MKTFRLGLIGASITESRSPALQVVCGLSVGLNVSYDLLIPKEQGASFLELIQRCQASGFDGVNVTYPFKEQTLKTLSSGDQVVQAIGASNTVCFAPSGTTAWNTDYTGFIAAYRAKWGQTKPGSVLLIGSGGVGRAIAFALRDLGAREILLHDVDEVKAGALADAVGASMAEPLQLGDLAGIDGVVNCTPLGMAGLEGSPLPNGAKGKPYWAFDAVYTPEHTRFRAQVKALGANFLSGYELYFHQGVQAFELFTGMKPDVDWVRKTLRRKI